jgi:hypothetical protein
MSRQISNPHSGGLSIPPAVQVRTKQRILDHAQANYAGKYTRLDIRFKNQFCYIDAFTEPSVPPDFPPPDFHESREQFIEGLRNTPTHLCRLRYFGDEASWSLAFYTYSHDKYQPCFFRNGTFFGTPEDAFDTGAVYL